MPLVIYGPDGRQLRAVEFVEEELEGCGPVDLRENQDGSDLGEDGSDEGRGSDEERGGSTQTVKPPAKSRILVPPYVMLRDAGIQLTTLTAASYAIYRFALDGFLRPFGLTSDAIGLDYGTIIETTGFMVVLFLILQSLLYWLRPAMLRITRYNPAIVAANLLSEAVIIAGVVGAFWFQNHLSDDIFGGNPPLMLRIFSYALVLMTGLIITISLIGGLVRLIGLLVSDPGTAPSRPKRVWLIIGSLVVAVAVAATFWASHTIGDGLAAKAQRGDTVELSILGLTLPGLEAYASQITLPDSAEPTRTRTRCMMYLGAANGLAVAYDPETNMTIRAPVLQVEIERSPKEDTCKGQ